MFLPKVDTSSSIARREALRKISLIIGGSISASTSALLFGGCSKHLSTRTKAAEHYFFPRQKLEILTRLTELIIPETDTPGAIAAQVPEYIQRVLVECSPSGDASSFATGISELDSRCVKKFGSPFLSCGAEHETLLLEELDKESFPDPMVEAAAYSAMEKRVAEGNPPFFRTLKELTVFGYYTSEIGSTQELRVMPMGVFHADVAYEKIGRAWVDG